MDFGCHRGASLFTWMQLSAIYQPYNHTRKIVGFDSFEGFSTINEKDLGEEGSDLALKCEGGMKFPGAFAELLDGIKLCDLNRPLGHVAKAEIIDGVLPGSFKRYLDQHQETVVSLASFGLGLYQPTVEVLRLLKPRLPKGAILIFEEVNQASWPGETAALFEVFSPSEISLDRLPYCPHNSWVKIGR